jgi:hypothetical protein
MAVAIGAVFARAVMTERSFSLFAQFIPYLAEDLTDYKTDIAAGYIFFPRIAGKQQLHDQIENVEY